MSESLESGGGLLLSWLEAFGDASKQVGWVQGFAEEQELMAIPICGGQQIGCGRLTGKQDDPALRKDAADVDCEIDAVHSRQRYIGDEHLGRLQQSGFECRVGIVGGDASVSVAGENLSKGVRNAALIIDDQDDRTIGDAVVPGPKLRDIAGHTVGGIFSFDHGHILWDSP